MIVSKTGAVFSYKFRIPDSAIDSNGHVNNVIYVQWMQDMAVRHFIALGGSELINRLGASWYVRSHRIEYLSPAYAGDEIEVRTWVANLRRVRSLRKYEFVNKSDGRLLVRGETEWVLVDAKSGRPIAIPEKLAKIFPLISNNLE
jgi:acyl-CoA thioester hydrolase